jgi:hypothetical protein
MLEKFARYRPREKHQSDKIRHAKRFIAGKEHERGYNGQNFPARGNRHRWYRAEMLHQRRVKHRAEPKHDRSKRDQT